jgi:hypothetical protein
MLTSFGDDEALFDDPGRRLRRPGIPRPGRNSPGLERTAIRFTVMPGELATGSGTRRCRSVPPSLAGPTVSVPPSLPSTPRSLGSVPGEAGMSASGQNAGGRAASFAARSGPAVPAYPCTVTGVPFALDTA